MRYQQLLSISALVTAIGCAAGTPPDSGPLPDRGPSASQAGVVTDAGGVVTTTGERSTAAILKIPPGHLPAPGQCRIWEPARPPGQQRHLPKGPCDTVERSVNPGQWVVFRPGENKKIVQVRTYEATSRGGAVLRLVRVFDIDTGVLLEELIP
jgi:hypothetical protein